MHPCRNANHLTSMQPRTRGSHLHTARRSVCDRDQDGIKRSRPLLPRARMREAGLSNRFCPSVSRLSSVRRIKLNFCHIDPHKPSKGSQTIANSKKLLYVYLTEVKALRLGCFSSYFLLFVTFGPTSSTSQYACCCIYGKRSLPHLGYGHTRTQYTR